MKKIWKKLASLFVMVLLFVMMLPETAFATEVNNADDMRLIFANVPSDWTAPCVWAWNEAGDTAFSAWPGESMDADAANEGWYYLYVPSWADHIIINANAGEVQTDEQILKDGNAWISITDSETVEVATEQKTKGDLPKYEETFKIHAKVDSGWENPCLWAWSAPDGKNAFDAWPGKALAEDADGWYVGKAPIWVNSIIVNGNGGDVQTEDVSVDPAELWLTVDAEGAYELSYTDPDKASVPNITVHVKAPADWSEPNLWAWSAPDGTNVFTTWPGEALTEEGDWLTKEIPGWVNSIIVNGNGGEIQTSDISIEAGKDVWVVVSGPEEYEVYYDEPDISDVEGITADGAKKSNALPIVGGVVGVAAIAGIAAVAVSKKKKA